MIVKSISLINFTGFTNRLCKYRKTEIMSFEQPVPDVSLLL